MTTTLDYKNQLIHLDKTDPVVVYNTLIHKGTLMTDSELIAKITNTAIIPFIERHDDEWDVDYVYDAWETVYFLFMKHRPELKEIDTEKKKKRRKQELEKQLLQIQKELTNL